MLFKKYGIKVETIFGIMKAKAEEAPNGDNNASTGNEGGESNTDDNNTGNDDNHTVNYEELIAKARKEEKDKMYKTVEDLKKQTKSLTDIHNKTLLDVASKDNKIAELEKQIKDLKKQKATPEDVEKLTRTVQELQIENQNLKDSQVNVEELKQKIDSEWEVKLYREQKLREVGNTVIPELVTGATKEEIDASIEVSQQRFTELVGSVRGNSYVPPANVNTQKYALKDVNPLDIQDMTMDDWAKQRALLGLK